MIGRISMVGLMAALSLAQTSTVTLYIPGADEQPLVGSIISADATITTYAIECAPGTDGNDCGFRGAFTLTENAATAKYTFPEEKDSNGTLMFTGYLDCSLAGTTSAVCVESFGGTDANFPGITTETYSGTDVAFMAVTITAGVAATAGSSPSSAVPSTTSGSATATSTSGTNTKTSSAGESSSAAAQGTTSTSTGGIPIVTGNAGWVIGGAAAALAMLA